MAKSTATFIQSASKIHMEGDIFSMEKQLYKHTHRVKDLNSRGHCPIQKEVWQLNKVTLDSDHWVELDFKYQFQLNHGT